MSKRGRFFFTLTLALTCAFVAGTGGYLFGYRQGAVSQQDPAVANAPQRGAQMQREVGVAQPPPAETGMTGFDSLLAEGAWYQLEQWLAANTQQIESRHGRALVSTMRGRVNKYDALVMRQVLKVYLDAQPLDHEAHFLLADLQQVSGLTELALETLFDVLQQPFGPDVLDQARIEADRIIQVIDAQLRNRGAASEREALWRHVSQRMPGSDRYRYEWAAALAGLKRWSEARRVLAETGTTDITQAAVDELAERVALAEEGVVFERDGERLLSRAIAPTGLTFTLLVDTGANVTSLSRQALRVLGAERLNEEVRIRTAGGIVATGVYRVAELNVQGQYFNNLRVIELPVTLPGLDGLLGLDIIHQLSADPLNLQP